MPIVHSAFKAAWWLPNRHLQTLWPVFIRRMPHLNVIRERIELPDGDFIDLDWLGKNDKGPILFLLHGLGGSIHSHYAGNWVHTANAQGLRCVVMHFRGCSGEPNRLQRNYHSGDTADLHLALTILQQREPETFIYGSGFSMGGNVLLKYLGERGSSSIFKAATAICVPLDLSVAANELQRGFARIYQWHLIRELKRYIQHKIAFRQLPQLQVDWPAIQTFWQFDDNVTAPLHGFRDVHDYYQQSSSKQFLKHITIPTLVVHAGDDPFMSDKVLPQAAELGDAVILEITKKGGHVGFVGGKVPGLASYWLEQRLMIFLKAHMEAA